MDKIKFWIGITLILGNFIMGFFAKLIPFMYFQTGMYTLTTWIWIAVAVYVFSLLMLFMGAYWIGKEGWNYIVSSYKKYQHETVRSLKESSHRTYSKVRDGVKQHISKTKKSETKTI